MQNDRPVIANWVAAIHSTDTDYLPHGTALVIDERRILTSAHVVTRDGVVQADLWVAFPMSPTAERRRVASIRLADHPMADLAVLELALPIPVGVGVAPLRCPSPSDVVGRRWWAFGFGRGDPRGNEADGRIGASLSYGWVRLDSESRYHVERGFSGGGLWCSDYEAVVAIVGEANDRGDGRAITVASALSYLPREKIEVLTRWTIADADASAQQRWAWTLGNDAETERHWDPRARGVATAAERGHRFKGRHEALQEVVSWLGRMTLDRKVLIVTGSPGVGKSAVLARVITTSDSESRSRLSKADTAVRAPIGLIGCAVHAKGKTAVDVSREVCRAASTAVSDRLEDVPTALRTTLQARQQGRFNIVLDALDEMSDSFQIRILVTQFILPIAQSCADVDVQVVIGSRRSDDEGPILSAFGPAATVIDLDEPYYFKIEDLTAYALATLQLKGDNRPENPYEVEAVAKPVATRIATLADQNFLVAGLVARTHGLYDNEAVEPSSISFTPDVESALSGYIARLAKLDDLDAMSALTALAYADSPGFTATLWRAAISAIFDKAISLAKLTQFARGSAGNFLVESTQERRTAGSPERVFRLFHQSLVDSLLAIRHRLHFPADDEGAIFVKFSEIGRSTGWALAPPYLLKSLAGHSSRAGSVDELLVDTDYILHADLTRLVPVVHSATSSDAREIGRLLRLTPRAAAVSADERLAMLSVTECLDGTTHRFTDSDRKTPYRARWAKGQARNERATLDAHNRPVRALCAIRSGSRDLLASASDDKTIMLWDPATGQLENTFVGHQSRVRGLCTVLIDGTHFLVSASADQTVRLWDVLSGTERCALRGHTSAVSTVCSVSHRGRELLASAGEDNVVRIWDPLTETEVFSFSGHTSWINDICALQSGGSFYVVSASDDDTIRVWDLEDDGQHHVLHGHTYWVNSVCALTIGDKNFLASASEDQTVRLWNVTSWNQCEVFRPHSAPITSIRTVNVDGVGQLFSASADRTARIWSPFGEVRQRILRGHSDTVTAVSAVSVGGSQLLVTAGADDSVRIWDPEELKSSTYAEGQRDSVAKVSTFRQGSLSILAETSGVQRRTRLWNLATQRQINTTEPVGDHLCVLDGTHFDTLYCLRDSTQLQRWTMTDGNSLRPELVVDLQDDHVFDICSILVDGHGCIVVASARHGVRVFKPSPVGVHVVAQFGSVFGGHSQFGGIYAVSAGRNQQQIAVVTHGGDGELIRLLNPHDDDSVGERRGSSRYASRYGSIPTIVTYSRVNSVCGLKVAGTNLLAAAMHSGEISLWDIDKYETPRQVGTLSGHSNAVMGVCVVQLNGKSLLASAANDRTVRLWDVGSGHSVEEVHVHHDALSVCSCGLGQVAVGLERGLLVIDFSY